jgi:hypothetical protein
MADYCVPPGGRNWTMDRSEKVSVYADSSYKATVAVRDFVESKLTPVLQAQVKTSGFEEALVGLYYRMVLWCRSLALLKGPEHFQTVRTGARAAFELHLDIHHLAGDPTLAAKMFAFTKLWKYRSAKKLLDFLAKYPELDAPSFRHQRILFNDATKAQEFQELLDRHWPPKGGKRKDPENWSGQSIYDLAHHAGPEFELRYREEYGFASLLVHSGIVAIESMSQEALITVYARGHMLFQESFLQATAIVCEKLYLFEAIPGLRGDLRKLQELPQQIIAQALMEADLRATEGEA